MRLARAALALAAAVVALGCRASIPEGVFRCRVDADCPPDFVCLPASNSPDHRCYEKSSIPAGASGSGAAAGVDGGADSGGRPAPGGAGAGGRGGSSGCGDACEDVDECATDNGGCGDPQDYECLNRPGAPPMCEPFDECTVQNGGCGDPAQWLCADELGAPPTCTDVDECTGNLVQSCGPGATSCTNVEGSFDCTCDRSFRLNPDARRCESRWSAPTLLETDDGAATEPRAAAIDANGSAVALWMQSGAAWTRRYVKGSGWVEPEDLEGGTGAARSAALAGNGTSATAVWVENGRVWASRYTPAALWGAPAMIDGTAGAALGVPEIVQGAGGHALAIWRAESAGSNTCADVWMNRSVQGAAWETAAALAAGGSTFCESTAVGAALGGTGAGLALWNHLQGAAFRVYASSCPWSAACSAAEPLSTGDNAADVVVATSTQGHTVAAWREIGAVDSAWIWTSRHAAGSGWSEPTMVDEGDVGRPSLAVDPAGNAMLVWPRADGPSRTAIMASRRGSQAVLWSDPVPIDSADAGLTWTPAELAACAPACASATAVGFDADGNATALWAQAPAGRAEAWMWANRYVMGDGWSKPVPFSTDDSGKAERPALAVDVMGNATAVWQQSDGTRTNIWASRFE